MRKSLFTPIFIIISLMTCCTNSNEIKCKLIGEIVDRKNGNLFLYRPESSRFDKDTIPFENGKFQYEIILKSPELYWLFFEEDELNDGGFTPVEFFVEEGNIYAKLSIDDIFNSEINGGALNEKLSAFTQFRRERNELYSEYLKADSVSKATIRQKIKIIDENRIAAIQKYVKENRDLLAAYFIWSMRQSVEKKELTDLYFPFNGKYRESCYIIETKAFIDGFDKNEEGQQYKDYKLLDTNDRQVRLSEIIKHNRATHLLFWSSRCGSTDGKLQAYKSIYEQYKDKGYEIIAISDDCDIDRWQRAISRNQATWKNLLDMDGNNAIEEYYHSSAEGDLLIDNSGKIISRGFRSSQLKDQLEEILK